MDSVSKKHEVRWGENLKQPGEAPRVHCILYILLVAVQAVCGVAPGKLGDIVSI